MKIFNTSQIKEIDEYTILHEPVSSIDLMERAANGCAIWLEKRFSFSEKFVVFAGPGNNGGDGLAIARLLMEKHFGNIKVFILNTGSPYSHDMRVNIERLHQAKVDLYEISQSSDMPTIERSSIVIDALFGSGLSRPLEGMAAKIVEHINGSGCRVISVDIPSGLFGEDNSGNSGSIIQATYTLTFQFPKRAFFYSENSVYTGMWHVIDIGLHPEAILENKTSHHYLTFEDIASRIMKRQLFSHKGNYGHGLLVAGSYGMTGAAILAAKACYMSGAGLVTCHVPERCYPIVQGAIPEAIFSMDRSPDIFTGIDAGKEYDALGTGPGLGTNEVTADALEELIERFRKPVIIDADALNIISVRKDLLDKLKPESIITPHPREFDRIFGECRSGYQRNMLQAEMAKKYGIIIVLKGAFTSVTMPDGSCYFNSTGNPGMATAGSGDVLTGIILALITQGYEPANAALIGPYVHGLAGDLAAEVTGYHALTASGIIDNLGKAFKKLETYG